MQRANCSIISAAAGFTKISVSTEKKPVSLFLSSFSNVHHRPFSSLALPWLPSSSSQNEVLQSPWPWQGKRQGNSYDRVRLSKRRTAAGSTRESGCPPVLELGMRLGQVGADVGACVGEIVQNVVQNFPRPFQHDDDKDLRCMFLIVSNWCVKYLSGQYKSRWRGYEGLKPVLFS